MKACEICGCEIFTRDGENRCKECDGGKKKRARISRREIDSAMRACGLVKVKGALGGTYWE